MMKLKIYFLMLVFVFTLISCTAAEINPSPEGINESTSTAPALNTLEKVSPSPTPQTEEEIPVESTHEASEGAVEQTQPTTIEAVEGSSEPVGSVDLSEITSEPPADQTRQVMPQPGVPDVGEQIGHEVSQDLAQRLGIDVDGVIVSSIDSREWADSGLGCPDPNMNYLTVMTPGFQIELEAGGEAYTYHTDRSGNFILCGQDGQPLIEE